MTTNLEDLKMIEKPEQHEIDRQCEIVLEQVRLQLIDGREAIERLIEFWRTLK